MAFKALNIKTGESIVILDPIWERKQAELRALSSRDELVCLGCREPMTTRLGHTRRWHFAHKHLKNCPYTAESPELIDTRAALYRWLISKPGVHVEIEQPFEGLPRYVDCYVEFNGRKFAYWIIDKPMRPEDREALKQGMKALEDVHITYVFASNMLRQSQDNANEIILTTTERDFKLASAYDRLYTPNARAARASLHYLDCQTDMLTTFRGLELVHGQQLHRGVRKQQPLAEVTFSPTTGEFTLPGEYEALARFEKDEALRRQKQEAQARRLQEFQQKRSEQQNKPSVSRFEAFSSPQLPVAQPANYTGEKAVGKCEFCGEETTDWWSYDGKTGLCKCRRCLRQRKG